MHAQIVDEQSREDETVEVAHHRAGQKENLAPLGDEHHLALDVQGLINVLCRLTNFHVHHWSALIKEYISQIVYNTSPKLISSENLPSSEDALVLLPNFSISSVVASSNTMLLLI